ncbi:hypothetical protein HW555_011953 [Spodoptera exigua]|uniref:Lipase domain-containing protein n=1 Tax=Spodoptera exigua TaxID=7107 RepID=A0A835G826_SPOEX|nr:hypothetical protein HW555_011953 [Spodoptera exigua]
MMTLAQFVFLLVGASVVLALPNGVFIPRTSLRYQHIQDDVGRLHLIDFWAPDTDFSARYNPDTQNQYHLFTRKNPTVSQPLVRGLEDLVKSSNFDASLRPAILIHGWGDDARGSFNAAVLAAFLAAEDMNVIVVDWSAGNSGLNLVRAVQNTILSGASVARFILWLNSVTGANLSQYHVVGYSLGGHQAGAVGRNLGGMVAYITALDPARPLFENNPDKFASSDAVYTEVIHTNGGGLGYLEPLGDVDFYPNGGVKMAGCLTSLVFHYFAESIRGGVFTGSKCKSYQHAVNGDCPSEDTLLMGGVKPKTGYSGVYYLQTNSWPPYSRG